MLLELIPISTLLTLLTTQILEVSIAAHDVLVEKQTLRLLTSFFMDIQPLLCELLKRELRNSSAVFQALRSLQNDVDRARALVHLCTCKSRIYLLLHCRTVTKEAEQISDDAAKSLALLSLAISEVAQDVGHNVDKIRQRMMAVEFQASEQKLRILEKIEADLCQRRNDEVAMNSLIKDIAAAVGLPSADAERKRVLENLRTEIEEASANKEKEEVLYMEQILALLSKPSPTILSFQGKSLGTDFEEEEPPLPSFLCPFTKAVMEDPVMISSGHSFERSCIQKWFDSGETTDPISRLPLTNLILRPNVQLQSIIAEWHERKNRLQMVKAGKKIISNDTTVVKEAMEDIHQLCQHIPKARTWLEEEQLVSSVVILLKHQNKDLSGRALSLIQTMISANEDLTGQLVAAGGVQNVVCCLKVESQYKLALGLLLQLVQAGTLGKPLKNRQACNELARTKGAIDLLVAFLHGKDADAASLSKEILEQLCDDDDNNVIAMAKANFFTPLLHSLGHGSEVSILCILNALAEMELTEPNKENLGEEGAVSLLIGLLSRKQEIKEAALKVLESLSSTENNKACMAEDGAMQLLLEILFSESYPHTMRESAALILNKLIMVKGGKYFVGANKTAINLCTTVQNVLLLQEKLFNLPSLRKRVLSLLLSILVAAQDLLEVRTSLKNARCISFLLPLLQNEEEIREVVLELLAHLSKDSAQDISLFLQRRNLGSLLASWLQDTGQMNVQVAAAKLLANLPVENNGLTNYLLKEGVLMALVSVMHYGSMTVKEGAVGALIRFTVPSDMRLQQKVVGLGIFPILKNLMKCGTPLSKYRAAIILSNFSRSTLILSTTPSSVGCFFLSRKHQSLCRVHPGFCRERTTFCLVESKMIFDIVCLLNDPKSDVAGPCIEALSTLVCEDEILEKGASVLHEEDAIVALLTVLSQGKDKSKQRVICMLERLFKVKWMRDLYGSHARRPLLALASNGNAGAVRVLARLEAVLE